jgi:hypothetical protein
MKFRNISLEGLEKVMSPFSKDGIIRALDQNVAWPKYEREI